MKPFNQDWAVEKKLFSLSLMMRKPSNSSLVGLFL